MCCSWFSAFRSYYRSEYKNDTNGGFLSSSPPFRPNLIDAMLVPSLAVLALASSVLAAALSAAEAKLETRKASVGAWSEIETLGTDYASLKEFVTASDWAAGGTNQFHVDASCNATQRRLIGEGLAEEFTLLKHARTHLRRFGNDTV